MVSPASSSPPPSTSTTKKKVAIVGCGVSGIITASVLQEDGHNVTLYEKEKHAGGVWAMKHLIPGLQLQNTAAQYFHPDFPYRTEPSDPHSSHAEMEVYWKKDIIQHYNLKIEYNTKVIELIELSTPKSGSETTDDNKKAWTVVTECNGSRKTTDYDFVVVAQGQYSRSMTKKDLPFKGVDVFEKAGGKVVIPRGDTSANSIAFQDLVQGQNVAVIGFGKTAVDACDQAAKHYANSVHHVFRTARWLLPKALFGKVSFIWLAFNRINGETIPSWDHAKSIFRWLHKAIPGVFTTLWGTVIPRVVWMSHTQPTWSIIKKSKNPTVTKANLEKFKPKHSLLWDHRVATAVCPVDFFSHVAADKVIPHQGAVKEFTETGILLESGEIVEANVIIPCIGNGHEAVEFPYLPKKYHNLVSGDCGIQLYRHMVHPDISNLAFVGCNHGILSVTHSYLGAIWISCLLHGELVLPKAEIQRDVISTIAKWKKDHISYEPTLFPSVHTRVFQYNDTLLMDLKINPNRKSNPISELLFPYGSADYAGVLNEVQKRRSKSTTPIILHPVERNM